MQPEEKRPKGMLTEDAEERVNEPEAAKQEYKSGTDFF